MGKQIACILLTQVNLDAIKEAVEGAGYEVVGQIV